MSGLIAPISAVGASTGAVVNASAFRFHGDNAIRAAARLFNMNEEDVSKMLARGDNLRDIAMSKGIGRGDLIAAIRQAFQADGNRLDYQTSTQLAQALANRRGKPLVARRDEEPHDAELPERR